MRLIDKHFLSHHKFHKLFNWNNVKLSYSCMSSMENVIQKHNSKIMENPKPTKNKTCTCRQKSDCSLNHNCLSKCLVYNAVVNTSATKNYYGTCEKSFKDRYNNHTSSFKNKSRQKIQSFLTTYENWKKMARITQSIGELLWGHIHTFVERENVIYFCVKN